MTTALEIMRGISDKQTQEFVDLLRSPKLKSIVGKLSAEFTSKNPGVTLPSDLLTVDESTAKKLEKFCKERDLTHDELKMLEEPCRSYALLTYIQNYNKEKRAARTFKKSNRVSHVYEVFSEIDFKEINQQKLRDSFTEEEWFQIFINGSEENRKYFPAECIGIIYDSSLKKINDLSGNAALGDILLIIPKSTLQHIVNLEKIDDTVISNNALRKGYSALSALVLGHLNIECAKEALEFFSQAYEIAPRKLKVSFTLSDKDFKALLKFAETRDEKTRDRYLQGLFFALWQQLTPGAIEVLFKQVKTEHNYYAYLSDLVMKNISAYSPDSECMAKKMENMCLREEAKQKGREFDSRFKLLKELQEKASATYKDLSSRAKSVTEEAARQKVDVPEIPEIPECELLNVTKIVFPAPAKDSILDAENKVFSDYIKDTTEQNQLLGKEIVSKQELLPQYTDIDKTLNQKEKKLEDTIALEMNAAHQQIQRLERGIFLSRKSSAEIEKDLSNYQGEYTLPSEVKVTVNNEAGPSLLPSLKKKAEALQREKDSLEKREEILKKEEKAVIDTLNKEIEQTKSEIEELKGKAQDAENQLAQLVKEYNLLTGSKEQVPKSLTITAPHLIEMSGIFYLVGKKKNLEEQRLAYENGLELLKSSVKEFEEKIKAANALLGTKAKKITELKTTIVTFRDQGKELENKIQVKRDELSLLRPNDKLPTTESLFPQAVDISEIGEVETQPNADAVIKTLQGEKETLDRRNNELKSLEKKLTEIISLENQNRTDARAFYVNTSEKIAELQKEILKEYHKSLRFSKWRFRKFDYDNKDQVAKAIKGIASRSFLRRLFAKKTSSSTNNQMRNALVLLYHTSRRFSVVSESTETGVKQYEALYSEANFLSGSPVIYDLKKDSRLESLITKLQDFLSKSLLVEIKRQETMVVTAFYGLEATRQKEREIGKKINELKAKAQPQDTYQQLIPVMPQDEAPKLETQPSVNKEQLKREFHDKIAALIQQLQKFSYNKDGNGNVQISFGEYKIPELITLWSDIKQSKDNDQLDPNFISEQFTKVGYTIVGFDLKGDGNKAYCSFGDDWLYQEHIQKRCFNVRYNAREASTTEKKLEFLVNCLEKCDAEGKVQTPKSSQSNKRSIFARRPVNSDIVQPINATLIPVGTD